VIDDAEVDRGDLVDAVAFVAGRRPLVVAGIVVLSTLTALLSGIGIGFIVPIVELAQSDVGSGSSGGLTGLFIAVYATMVGTLPRWLNDWRRKETRGSCSYRRSGSSVVAFRRRTR